MAAAPNERFFPADPDLVYAALLQAVVDTARPKGNDDPSRSVTFVTQPSGLTGNTQMSAQVLPADGGSIVRVSGSSNRTPDFKAGSAGEKNVLKILDSTGGHVQRLTTPEPKSAPAGWYPHPTMAATQQYWDGTAWTDNIAPGLPAAPASATPAPSDAQSQVIVVLILAASVVGTIMALQSASLFTGTGTQWTGAAIAVASGIATYVLRRSIPTWLRVISVLAALLALANVIYLEVQLEDKRQEISEILP